MESSTPVPSTGAGTTPRAIPRTATLMLVRRDFVTDQHLVVDVRDFTNKLVEDLGGDARKFGTVYVSRKGSDAIELAIKIDATHIDPDVLIAKYGATDFVAKQVIGSTPFHFLAKTVTGRRLYDHATPSKSLNDKTMSLIAMGLFQAAFDKQSGTVKGSRIDRILALGAPSRADRNVYVDDAGNTFGKIDKKDGLADTFSKIPMPKGYDGRAFEIGLLAHPNDDKVTLVMATAVGDNKVMGTTLTEIDKVLAGKGNDAAWRPFYEGYTGAKIQGISTPMKDGTVLITSKNPENFTTTMAYRAEAKDGKVTLTATGNGHGLPDVKGSVLHSNTEGGKTVFTILGDDEAGRPVYTYEIKPNL